MTTESSQMGVKPDKWIIDLAKNKGMIEPFQEELLKKGSISFGPSSYGYDFRVDRHFKIFTGTAEDEIDPKRPENRLFADYSGTSCLIPPHSFILAKSLEYFRIPRDILTICTGKSTYARCGILVNVTPFEPEWEGYVTMSISNLAPSPVRIYAEEGIAQLIFLAAEEECAISYKDRKGKYQAQKNIVLSRVD